MRASIQKEARIVCDVVYGTNPTLTMGTTTATVQSIGSGTGTVSVTAPLTGLEPGTTYYFQVVASSSGGTGPALSRALPPWSHPPPPRSWS